LIFGILVMFTALTISAVAIYYSVAGLAAIFAAAVIPIIIMGGVLEVAKLVTAVWLHKYWTQAKWWLKYYLTTAVVILMFITSMGIFGFLSKAHIEQTSAGDESVAQISRIEGELVRQEDIVTRAELKIKELETTGTGGQSNIQAQIDKEQERISTAYDRIKPAIAEQNVIIANVTNLFQGELDKIDNQLAKLQGYIESNDIKKAQGMIGAKADGTYGPKTATAFTLWQDAKKVERNSWLQKIQDSAQSSTVTTARDEIKRLRASADTQIAESNKLINKYRDQLTADTKTDITSLIEQQYLKITTANQQVDTLTEEKYTIQREYRKLEAEVGPIKYIAEFVYGEAADRNMLEEAVRWVIITIIFVFDPLAVLLLIASQYTFQFIKRSKQEDFDQAEYDRVRAQAIVNNVPPQFEDVSDEELQKELDDELGPADRYEDISDEELQKELDNEQNAQLPPTDEIDHLIEEEINNIAEEIAEETLSIVEEYKEVELPAEPKQSKATNSTPNMGIVLEASRLTESQINELDTLPLWTEAKRKWKDEHPNLTIKSYKEKYLAGEIDSLPWESYIEDDSSDSNDTTVDTGYIQNEEQTNDTTWRMVRDKDE
jgi:hypothetical protein